MDKEGNAMKKVQTVTGFRVAVTKAQAKTIARLRRKYGAELSIFYRTGGGVEVKVFGRTLISTRRRKV